MNNERFLSLPGLTPGDRFRNRAGESHKRGFRAPERSVLKKNFGAAEAVNRHPVQIDQIEASLTSVDSDIARYALNDPLIGRRTA
jgi:hypothetical protein